MGELQHQLGDTGWITGLWKVDGRNRHFLNKASKTATWLGIDGGETVGLAILGGSRLLLAVKNCHSVYRAIEETVAATRTVWVYSAKRRKELVVAIEAGYCPSQVAVGFTYGVWGAIRAMFPEVKVFLVPPHRKPPKRTVKLHTEKVRYLDEDLTEWGFIPQDGGMVQVPTGLRQHTASALGVLEYATTVWLPTVAKVGVVDGTEGVGLRVAETAEG